MAHIVAQIPEFRVKFKDVFSLKNLYVMLHEILLEEGWWGFETGEATRGSELHADIETLYSENVFQKGIHQGGKEIWVWWRSQRGSSVGKPHGYFRDLLDIDWHVAYSQEREVMHQGKKLHVQWGELELFFRPRVEGDYKNTWGKHRLLKHFQHTYEHRIMHQDIEKREKELWRDSYRIASKVKTFLNLRTYMPVADQFHPKLYGMEE
jgi:hypothetical protein